MSKDFQKELNVLTAEGIISAETAQQINAYYLTKKETSNKFPAVLAILGALLVGFGIILLIAHNWDTFNKTVKTIFAFSPLLIGQGLCVFTLLQKKENTVWREGSAVILFFAVGSCIALISQVYHISGSLEEFILTWMLLVLPLVYIMGSAVVSLLYITGITWFSCLIGYNFSFSGHIPWWYAVLLLVILPHYYEYFRLKRDSNFFHLLNWFLVVSIVIVLGTFAVHSDSVNIVFTAYMALFATAYLIGNSSIFKDVNFFLNPFLIVGTIGTIVCFLTWSFHFLWQDNYNEPLLSVNTISAIAILLLLLSTYLLFRNLQKRDTKQIDLPGFSGIVFAVCVLLFARMENTGAFLVNVWIVAIAIYYIRKGALQNHFGILNFGLLIFASLAIMRFFDDYIPFIWRGLFFLVAGIVFFLANFFLIKKRKQIINPE